MVLSSSVDKYKAANILRSVEQIFIQDVFTANAIANTTVTENTASTLVNNTSEISKDVIEVSPTQRSVTSKVKQSLKLKRKISIKHIDFELCPSPKHTFMQMGDKSLMNTTINTLKDKN